MRSNVNGLLTEYKYTPEVIADKLKSVNLYNKNHSLKESFAKEVMDEVIIYDEYNVKHKMSLYSYFRNPKLTSLSAEDYYYNSDRIYDLYKNKTGNIPKENLSLAKAKGMRDYIVLISNYNIRHKMVLYNYIKGTRLNIENAIDKNELLKIQFEKKHKGKYDYSKVDYKGNHNPILIICKVHGIYSQTPSNHKKGAGCRKCSERLIGDINKIKNRVLPLELVQISSRVRALIKKAYKSKKINKNTKTEEILGCSWVAFKQHLENNPYGFKITDKDLDLDHIVPISSAKTEEDIILLNKYSNLQLLPSQYNRYIKTNKKWDSVDFKTWIKTNILDNNQKTQLVQ